MKRAVLVLKVFVMARLFSLMFIGELRYMIPDLQLQYIIFLASILNTLTFTSWVVSQKLSKS